MRATILVAAIVTAFGAGYLAANRWHSRPGRTEIFALRSQCAELADKIARKSGPFNSVAKSLSRYDSDTNRCYAEMDINSLKDDLYDAQTGEVLAEVWKGAGENHYLKGGSKNPSRGSVRAFIDRTMSDDRSR